MNEPNDTVYIAGKAPMTQHPQKCRIGVCYGSPILEEGWNMFSSMKGDDADTIYDSIMKSLDEVKASNYDAINDAWMIPLVVLDKWMTSKAELLHLRNPARREMEYFKHC